MASSLVEIANIALSYVGAEMIISLDDPVKSAILCKELWPSARDAVLRSYPWNCAIKRTVLAPLTEKPSSRWGNQFLLPGDNLRLLSVEDGVDYAVEGRRLLADDEVVRIKYISRVEDPNAYDSLLVQALAAYLAHMLANPLVQSATLKDQMFQQFRAYCKQARSIDAQESQPGKDPWQYGWIEARG
jgi:hypothetical protein